ncbi:hypothetical protein DL764_006849 [Monosporascus ibericus]|uniref:Class II aldolase/adducin N-terminal domain-containing protein n=1 Tax=Monosporascus ibericus TaxID=155417 RepID=A0A4Q4T5X8_9PEZI|nr:hypothetical protein DL764_006849 [Monosporascus ibericus]
MTRHHERLSPVLVETIAGLSAGTVATLLVHPLDIVKTRMQIHRSHGASPTGLTTVSVIRELMQTPHPVAALYRGLTPNILGSASSWASFFFFKARVERVVLGLKTSTGNVNASLTPRDYFISSGVAGLFTQALTNPIWVLKTRMLSSDRGAVGAYPSMWVGVAQILKTEGWRGFYRGLGISLFGVTHGAVQFAVYDPLKKMYFRRRKRLRTSDQAEAHAQQKLGNEATLIMSSISKLVAGAVTYPYQVIRSRLQNYDAEERFGRGIQGVARRTWQEEGWRGFYRGIIPGVPISPIRNLRVQRKEELPLIDEPRGLSSTDFSYTMAPSATQPPPGTAVFSKVSNGNGPVATQKKQENPPQVQFSTLEEEREYRKQHLAAAFRVFADRGYDEGVAGHISVRDPILTDHFCLGSDPDGRGRVGGGGRRADQHGGGVVVDRAEGERIAAALGPANKALILQNHGLLTVGRSVDEAVFWFISLERTCQAQLLADAADAAAAAGYEKKYISDEEAAYGVQEVGGPDKGWLAFQPYYDEQMARTKGAFLG